MKKFSRNNIKIILSVCVILFSGPAMMAAQETVSNGNHATTPVFQYPVSPLNLSYLTQMGFNNQSTSSESIVPENKPEFITSLQALFEHNTPIANFIISIGVIILLIFIRLFILRLVWKNTEDVNLRYRWRKNLSYVVLGIGIIVISQIWIKEFKTIITYIGLVSAGIAIALKDLFINFFGWVFIISTKPFVEGDRVEIDSVAGDVIDITAFQFTILEIGNWVNADQSTGRILHIPNGKLFTYPIANYSKAFKYIWNEISITVTFSSDWKKAKQLLQEIIDNSHENLAKKAERSIKDASKKFMIYYSTITPIVYSEITGSGVLLTMRYLCDIRRRRVSANELWESILSEFSQHSDVEFAYTTYSVHQPAPAPHPPKK